MNYWGGRGIHIFSSVDDFFGGASTYHQTAIISAKVKMDFELSEFVANVKKSQCMASISRGYAFRIFGRPEEWHFHSIVVQS